jgi:hypothetical protein
MTAWHARAYRCTAHDVMPYINAAASAAAVCSLFPTPEQRTRPLWGRGPLACTTTGSSLYQVMGLLLRYWGSAALPRTLTSSSSS